MKGNNSKSSNDNRKLRHGGEYILGCLEITLFESLGAQPSYCGQDDKVKVLKNSIITVFHP